MSDDPELIPVRPDERLDPTRLEPWLRAHLPETAGALSIRQFGGGHANLTYLVAFGETEYVLRRPPLGPVAPRSHDMAREHRVLARLGDRFPLAPRSFALCRDDAVIGAPFHVMERRRGLVIRHQLPEALRRDPERVRRLSEMLIDTLADLHRVDPAAVGLGDLGRPDGFVERQLEGWTARWDAAREQELPAMQELATWLRAHLPAAGVPTLLHNDYKLDNLVVEAADPTAPTAVLDWDMCTRGDALMDLGYLLNLWVEADDDDAWRQTTSAMPSHETGFLRRRDAVERYARRTGFAVDDVRWFYAFGVFKFAVILQQIYIRYRRGQTRDRRFATLGDGVRILAAKGVDVTRRADPV